MTTTVSILLCAWAVGFVLGFQVRMIRNSLNAA